MADILWDKKRDPTPYVWETLGITEIQLGEAIHKIKAASNLGGRDRVIIYTDGNVKDENGEDVGNIHDEV